MIMTSTSERQVDATAVAAMPAPAVPPAGLDISHIPPTPDDLFVQWKVSRRTAWRAAVAAVFALNLGRGDRAAGHRAGAAAARSRRCPRILEIYALVVVACAAAAIRRTGPRSNAAAARFVGATRAGAISL